MRDASVALYIQPISAFENGERLLSIEERSRAERFASSSARLAFVAGRILIRRALGQRLDCPPEQLMIVISATGRPELDPDRHPEGLSFSLSHSASAMALAVSANRVGVDIEAKDRRADFARLARRILGVGESGLAERMAAEKAMFLAVWTAKEAAAKAAGTGLRFDPRRFQLIGDPQPSGAPIAVRCADNTEVWIRSVAVEGEICAVASTERNFEVDLLAPP